MLVGHLRCVVILVFLFIFFHFVRSYCVVIAVADSYASCEMRLSCQTVTVTFFRFRVPWDCVRR